MLEVIKACEKFVGKPIAYEVKPRRDGDPPVLVARCDKLKKKLG